MTMRFKEFMSQASDPMLVNVHPDQEKRKRMQNKLELAIAFQDARHIPSDDDVAMAFAKVSQLQRQANKRYAARNLATIKPKEISE